MAGSGVKVNGEVGTGIGATGVGVSAKRAVQSVCVMSLSIQIKG
jgi:hypothetical protein